MRTAAPHACALAGHVAQNTELTQLTELGAGRFAGLYLLITGTPAMTPRGLIVPHRVHMRRLGTAYVAGL